MSKQNILIIEDVKNASEQLSDYLSLSGFNVSLLDSGDHVVQEISLNTPDLIILDIMLPGEYGISLYKELRACSNIPILILSANSNELDCIHYFESGADDYISKPYSPKEAIARIKAILRRISPVETTEKKLCAGPITINTDSYNATISGKRLNLTLVEFELLKLMASMPNNVFTRSDLISGIKGYDLKGSERVIDTHIKNLRKKLDKCIPNNNLINTVYGMGYSLKIPQTDNVSNA